MIIGKSYKYKINKSTEYRTCNRKKMEIRSQILTKWPIYKEIRSKWIENGKLT